MTREEKMQAVVEAARKVVHTPIFRGPSEHILALADALAALDAPDTADETVTLTVWEWPTDGDIRFCRVDSEDPPMPPWTRLGTVTLPITREGGR